MQAVRYAVTILSVFLMSAALSLAAGAAELDMKAFTLKNGRVHKGNTALDCDVHEVPSGIQGPVRFWSTFGPDASHTVTQGETGVWFFSSKGESLRHIPLESESICQGIFFSPDESALAIQTGNKTGADVSFDVYSNSPEKLTELAGIRGSLAWLDPVRLVMTRIDDTRGGPNYENRGGPAFGWRTSIVMFDIASKKIVVLKESTATQNFWFDSIIQGGKALNGREDYVTSESDWGDEAKEKKRQIRIEIPAI